MTVDKPRIVLIDLSSLFWTAWMVNNENGIQQARSVTLANVKRCMADPSDLVAICCDSGKSFRKDLSPDYKANREKQPEAAYGELQKTKDRLRADGYLLWEAPTFEADDVIATACDRAVTAGHQVRIASADKDLLQLVGENVDCLRTHTWSVVGVKEFTEKYKIRPVQFGDWLSLKGDSSDNIPGCDGIGDKWASDLIVRFGTVAKLYAALDDGKADLPKKLTENLIACREKVDLSRKLVELSFEAPINFEDIYAERKQQPLTNGAADMADEPEEAGDMPATDAVPEPAGTPAAEAKPQTAMTYVPPAEFDRQLEPMSIRGAYKLACGLENSRLYTRFPNAEAIMAVIIRGRELGLGALTSLDSFHLIENRPVPHAYLMIARAKADPDCEYLYCEDTTEEKATWVTKNKRNPKETRLTYTLAQARSSGLVIDAREKTDRDGKKYMSKPNQWVVRPAEMVRKTCGVQLARMEYPAAVMGLYAWEELGGDE